MKSSLVIGGRLSLLLVFSVMVSSCNKEQFFKSQEFLVGDDAACFKDGPDLAACHAIGNKCIAAYVDAKDPTNEPEFYMCIANPDYTTVTDPSDSSGSSDGSVAGSTSGGTSGSGTTTGGTSGSGTTTGGTSGSGMTTGGTSGSGTTTGGTSGSSTTTGGISGSGTTNGGTTGTGDHAGSTVGGSTGSVDPSHDYVNPNDSAAPTIREAYEANCSNVSAKYLWTKKETTKLNGTVTTSKVKVCHQTSSSSVSIVIACPALKAHIAHEDYLGVCK